jgi:phage gpG-like protein
VRSFFRKISQETGQESLQFVREQFKGGFDPAGNLWPRPKAGGTPMRDTGALSRSFRLSLRDDLFELGTSRPYAPFLQKGTSRMSARRMLPGARLPARWKERLAPIVKRHMRDALKGAKT